MDYQGYVENIAEFAKSHVLCHDKQKQRRRSLEIFMRMRPKESNFIKDMFDMRRNEK